MKITKKLFIGLVASVFALSACSSDDDNNAPAGGGDAALVVDPASINAPAVASTYTINVTAQRGEWTAYTDASWITIENANTNSSTGTITATIAANTVGYRQATINVRSGSARQSISVTQQAPLSVDKTVTRFASIGGKDTITVSALENWNVTAGADWIQVNKLDATHAEITTSANDAHESRTGDVTISTPSESLKVSVVQESVDDREMVIPEGYVLDWHDEFDYNGQLNSDWTEEAQPAGWVNNEQQTYIKGTSVNEVKDGALNIHCFKGNDGKIYSGRVYAKVGTGWKYGYFEARMKLPKGKGTWPAFWMMPVGNNYSTNPWPGCGEIDIMEEVGVTPNHVTSSIHCNKYNNGNTPTEHCDNLLETAESDYHIYGCEWTPDFIRFYVDRKPVLTYNNDHSGKDQWPFDYAFYPILNLAWGGSWGGMNGVDESALPITLNIDYLRVFVKK